VSRGTAGTVEVYHALCLWQGAEPLRPPLTVVVGGLVTDFEAHGVSFELMSVYGQSGAEWGAECAVPQLAHGRPT
jgi:hypothetical protein